MIKPVLKTLSLSFAVFAAASVSADEQNPTMHLASLSVESVREVCKPQELIDRGWDQQIELLEARLEMKDAPLTVPGAIIASPFDDASKDSGRTVAHRKALKPSARTASTRF